MKKLDRANTDSDKILPIKVMQFGGGNFLRGFVDWMVQTLNDLTDFKGGVVVVKPTEHGDYQLLKSQDGLFTVILDGISSGESFTEIKQIDCVQGIINPYTEWERYLELAQQSDIRFVVSNTTEAGIRFNTEDRLADSPPKEFPAKLTVWLYRRFQHFAADTSKGCIILPCELIVDNGFVLQETILQYSEHWGLGDAFDNWIKTNNYFCNTLVDRIVSGYPTDREKHFQNKLGYKDELMVAGEYYHSWVIQGPEVAQKELPFSQTALNVFFVEELAPYREMKVRILNGAHTAMVPVGFMLGMRTVKDCMADEAMSHFVKSLLQEEVAPTLDLPDDRKQLFIADVLNRFENPFVKHRLESIALNSISKFRTRLLPTLKDFYDRYQELPERIVFVLAALIRYYKGEFKGSIIELRDESESIQFFAEQWAKYEGKESSMKALIVAILSNKSLWGTDMTAFEGLAERVTRYGAAIEQEAVHKTLMSLDNF
ncbi:tagaturonate reductase [Flavobacteriaceae bacterium TP-CH-4]|uniref:Tagaturonate reductase n=1 Tax=Pelagihabitans pacificus TaxID=2696054 RepID=A0A967AZS3_9FLAO|nr:tagaturonate reductase [Pelagihabitans pacificus]NHF59516.1 tagaturonate reductase [Pelagihabitans pacificus]